MLTTTDFVDTDIIPRGLVSHVAYKTQKQQGIEKEIKR